MLVDETDNTITSLVVTPGQTAGTASGATCSAIEPIGETSIALSSAGTGTIVIGDIVTFDGKLKLISTGCGEVAVAVNNAKNYIDPSAKVNPGHSTDRHDLVRRKWARREKAAAQQAKTEMSKPE